MEDRSPLIPVIVGPTAVGKTSLAIALAEHWPLTVISADSRQVYRGLDIGTSKPTFEERTRVPHRGIDVVDPGEPYSAGRFSRDALGWIDDAGPECFPVVVGGTGFYVRALTSGIFVEPEIEDGRRVALRAWASGSDRIEEFAQRLDPRYAGGSGRQRAARAIEVALFSGRPLSWWHEHSDRTGSLRPWYIRLTATRSELHRRIAARTERMLASGWIAEVESVLSSGVDPEAAGLDAVGYREIVQHLRSEGGGEGEGKGGGNNSLDELTDRINTATRRYAKRQETWFRHQLDDGPVVCLDTEASAQAMAESVVQRWSERERE